MRADTEYFALLKSTTFYNLLYLQLILSQRCPCCLVGRISMECKVSSDLMDRTHRFRCSDMEMHHTSFRTSTNPEVAHLLFVHQSESVAIINWLHEEIDWVSPQPVLTKRSTFCYCERSCFLGSVGPAQIISSEPYGRQLGQFPEKFKGLSTNAQAQTVPVLHLSK